jgi:cytochrome c biogenesis protein CcdA
MAKPTKHATPICIALTIIAALGIILGLVFVQPLIPIILLIPTAIYEVYRTEGKSAKAASWGMLGLLIAELLFVLFGIDFELAQFLGRSATYIRGYSIPLGNIQVISPSLMAVLSVVLISNTRGRYTKWLAAIIFTTAFAIIYTVDPTIFQELLKLAVDEKLRKL